MTDARPARRAHRRARSPDRRPRRLRGDGRRGAGRHRRGRDRGGRHRRRLAAAALRRLGRTVGVFDGERLVGYAEVAGATAATRPSTRSTAAAASAPRSPAGCRTPPARRGSTIVGMPVPEGSSGDRLLEALGYHVRWTSWVLKLPAGRRDPERDAARGVRRPRGRRPDESACWTVVEDAFLEWSVRERELLRGLRAIVRAARLRAVEPARRRPTPTGDGRRRCRDPDRTARPRATSPGSPPAGTSAAGGSPRRCWSTRSRSAREHGAPRPGCPPTRAPARSASTRRSA